MLSQKLFTKIASCTSKAMKISFRRLLALITATLAVSATSATPAIPVEIAPNSPDTKLLGLAKNHFREDIWPAEEKLFRAAAEGENADSSQGTGEEADPAKAAAWKAGQVIRSDRLKWLCTDPEASALVSAHGISILGARIDGVLNLQWAKITYPLQIRRCAFTEKVILERSHLRSLDLQATSMKELAGAGLNVEDNLTMSHGFKAEGTVQLMNATIGGNFECDTGEFIGADGIALDASWAKIGENVSLSQAHFEGGVDFNGATISGIFACDGAQFINGKGIALSLDTAKIDRNLFLRHAKFAGEVWLYNANIGGNFECSGGTFTGAESEALNASWAKIGENVSLSQAHFEGGVDFNGATISGIFACDGAQFINGKGIALSLDRAKIDRNLFLRMANFQGGVWLFNATIGLNVECSGGTFAGSQFALIASLAKIGQSVYLANARFKGAVDFDNSTIGGIFHLEGGQFINGNGKSLSLESAKIDRTVLLRMAHFEGDVFLQGATIGGDLSCDGGQFIGGPGNALDAAEVKIENSVFLRRGFDAEGKVVFTNARISRDFQLDGVIWSQNAILDLRHAKVGTLLNNEKSWPKKGNLFLEGFIYDEIDDRASLSAHTQIEWLHLQPQGPFRPQPYDQLAAVLRNMGLEEDAVEVMVAKNKDHGRKADNPVDWSWYNGPEKLLIGYAYHPWHALLSSVVVVAIGGVVFRSGYRHGILSPRDEKAYVIGSDGVRQLSETYPKFNAFIYSLESFIPLLKLDMGQYWMPNANAFNEFRLPEFALHLAFGKRGRKLRFHRFVLPTGSFVRCYLWLHIIAGVILTALWVGGMTGLLKG
jgi:hypothetical protein